MRGRKNRDSYDINVNLHANDPRRPMLAPGVLIGILITLFFVGGILIWFCLPDLENGMGGRVLFTEIVVSLLLFLGNLFGICRVGYDGFKQDALATWAVGTVLSVLGFYIAGVHIMGGFMGFMLLLVLAVFLSIIPALLISLCMWVIVAVFGNN